MRGSVRDAPREKTLNGVGDRPRPSASALAPSRLPDPLIPLAEGCQAEKSFAQHRLRPTGVVRENEEETEEEGGKGVCPSVRPEQSHQKAIWLQRICKAAAAATTAAEKRRGGGRKEGRREATGTNPHSKNCPSERARGSPPPQRGSSRRRPFRSGLLLLHGPEQSRAEQSGANLQSQKRSSGKRINLGVRQTQTDILTTKPAREAKEEGTGLSATRVGSVKNGDERPDRGEGGTKVLAFPVDRHHSLDLSRKVDSTDFGEPVGVEAREGGSGEEGTLK